MQDYHPGFDSRISAKILFPNLYFQSLDLNAPSRIWRFYDLQKVYPLINECYLSNSWLQLCLYNVAKKIICCGVTHQRRVPIPYMNSINVRKSNVMPILQVWVIWIKLSSKPTDRDLDLLTSLTNLPLKHGAKLKLTKYLILPAPIW